MIEYKRFIGHFKFKESKNMFYGMVVNTYDLIIFQGKSVKETELNFRDSINEHLAWCKKYGKKPEKHFSLK